MDLGMDTKAMKELAQQLAKNLKTEADLAQLVSVVPAHPRPQS